MAFVNNTFTLDYPKNKNRIDIYDFLRGFAMLLVIIQHAVIPGWRYLLTFHMPLFFFLSGLVSGNKELPTFGKYAWTRFKRLMIVYFVFGLLDISIYYVGSIVIHKPYDIMMALLGVLTGQYGFVPTAFSGIYWFLFVMFMADLLIYPFVKYAKNNKFILLGGTLMFTLLSYGSTHWFTLSIFTIDKSFMAAVFLLLGSMCKPIAKYLLDLQFRWVEVFMIGVGILGIWLSKEMNPESVLMFKNQYGDYLWFFIGAITGILAVFFIGKYLYILLSNSENIVYRLLMWIGFNSLILFPVHLEIKQYFGHALEHFGLYNWILILLIMIVLSIPLCNFITHYMPWILGQFPNKVVRN